MSTPRRKVLIADDDPSILQLLVLTFCGGDWFDCISATDGEEALRLAHEEKPDIALLDILMPKMDGIEVCRRLKSDDWTAGIGVVMVTALAQEMEEVRARAAGADAYITKPFSPVALMRTVERLLAA